MARRREVAHDAAERMHAMEEEVAELSTSPIAKAHRGFMGGMTKFLGSWWGMLAIAIVLLGLVIALLTVWHHRRKRAPPPPPGDAPQPSAQPSPQPSGEEVTVHMAWEAARPPTTEDKIILFNVGAPDIAWSCCAAAVFKSHREVRVRLPPGNYAARTVHRSGLQQVCSLETSRRVAFTDAATRCTSGEMPPDAKEIELGVCETLVTD